MMMAMPASDREFARIDAHACAPMALALAPSATNTVEKPSTNNKAAAMVSVRTRGSGSASARRSSEVPVR